MSYRRIIDKGRAYVEEHYRRPLRDRLLRATLSRTLPYPGRLRLALWLAAAARPFAGLFERIPSLRPLSNLLRLSRAAPRVRRPRAQRTPRFPDRSC